MNEETVAVEMMQLNVKIPKTLATNAKRIAAHRGVTLNALMEDQIKRLMKEDAEALRDQIRAEREQSEREERELERQLASFEFEPAR